MASYPGVKKLQEYLESLKDTLGFTKSLKDADGSFDGKYGPDTDVAFWAWMEKLPDGSDLTSLVPHVLTPDDYAQVTMAQKEFGSSRTTGPKPDETKTTAAGPAAPAVVDDKWPAWKWMLLGAGVATAGVLTWYVVKQGMETKPAPAVGGCSCGS
jgi:hypothetical protein